MISMTTRRLISNRLSQVLRVLVREMSSSENAPRQRRRRFAPLDQSRDNVHAAPQLKGIVFDVDGTLCLPQNYMFREMREALGIPKSVDILDHIRSLSNESDGHHQTNASLNSESGSSEEVLSHTVPVPDQSADLSPQAQAVAKIQAIERNAMTSQRPQPGLQELMAYLTRRNVRKGLCTRNFPAPVHHLLDKYLLGEVFEPIITRESDGIQPKPSPEGIWHIAQSWGLAKEVISHTQSTNANNTMDPLQLAKAYLGSGLIMVGDSIDDMVAGYRAGAATVLLANDENEKLVQHEFTDLSIKRLDDLIEILETGFEGRLIEQTDLASELRQ